MKSTGTAYLLWFFGGFLGLHRFYLDRPGTGIIYLLTLGLFGLGVLADLFLIPGMVSNCNLKFANLFAGNNQVQQVVVNLQGAPAQVPAEEIAE